MAFCRNCGAEVKDDAKFCPSCGAATSDKSDFEQKVNETAKKVADLNNTADTTSEFDPQDIENNKVFAALAYLGVLVLVPILAAKDSKYAMYHANQGLILFIAQIVLSVIVSIIISISSILGFISGIFNLIVLVVQIIGLVNAIQGRAKELPIVGKYRILNY